MTHEGARTLVVASDPATREQLAALLTDTGHVVKSASSTMEALVLIERAIPDLVMVELALGDEPAFAFLARVRELTSATSIVALAAEGSTDTIVEAIKRGADHCLTRPIQPDAFGIVVDRALDKPLLARQALEAEEIATERLDRGHFDKIVGGHPAMQRLLNKAYQAARSRATVLITGETGTGKELIAAAIHRNSRRADNPFVRLNCASLAHSVLESELFGHEKGAFTGAGLQRKGRFEQAHNGTLFLDEVSEIPLDIQVKLLRFLQEREFERVGGDKTLCVDVRVVAAANRDLKAMVDDRSFREDLYYRLNVVRLEVPPLRARPSDILVLADWFLNRYAAENEVQVTRFTDSAREALLSHPWPGNVRELQNMIEQAVVLCEGEAIDAADLPIAAEPAEDEPLRLMIPGITLAELERYAILKTLESVGGSPSRAAAILGVSRRTVQYRMRAWGMGVRPNGPGDEDSSPPPASDYLDK